jgi:hypothetical protein
MSGCGSQAPCSVQARVGGRGSAYRVVEGGAVLLKAEAAEQSIDPGHAHLVRGRNGVRVRVGVRGQG